MYLTDRDSSVCLMYTLDGKPIQMLGRHGVHSDTGCERPGDLVPRAAGPFNYPSELVPAPSGDLYVSDGYRNARVHRFTWDGQLKKSWGEPGKTAPGHFHLPHSLIVANDKVYVCDRENHRLQVFNLDGESLDIWTDIQRPMDISVDRDGVFYVSEGNVNGSSARVSVLDTAGEVLARFVAGVRATEAGSILTGTSMSGWAIRAGSTNSCARDKSGNITDNRRGKPFHARRRAMHIV